MTSPSSDPRTAQEAESLAVPAEDGLGLDDHERAAPVAPQAKEPQPEDPIRALQPDAASPKLALKDGHLVAEGQDLGAQGGVASEEARQRQQERPEGRTHGATGVAGVQESSSVSVGSSFREAQRAFERP